jgi:hypothetical protein
MRFSMKPLTVTSRSKTIAALRLCVLDGNGTDVVENNFTNFHFLKPSFWL